MDELSWLRLQVEWGADEALEDLPRNRIAPAPLPLPASPARATPLETARALAASAASRDALREALAGFDGCALRATATSLVFCDGDPAAMTVLIAEAPGAAEDRAGLPFAGPAAALLDEMLGSAGLARGAMYALSLLPWRPPGDRKPAEAEIELCLPFLQRHLSLLRPKRLVVFGSLASRTLLPHAARRGAAGWHEAQSGLEHPLPTLVLPSLGLIKSTPAAKAAAWANLLLLRRAIDKDHS